MKGRTAYNTGTMTLRMERQSLKSMGKTMARAEEDALEEEDSITIKEQLSVLWNPQYLQCYEPCTSMFICCLEKTGYPHPKLYSSIFSL